MSETTPSCQAWPTRLRRVGAPGRARTCDPRLRRPMLYPTELRARRSIVAEHCGVGLLNVGGDEGVAMAMGGVQPRRLRPGCGRGNTVLRQRAASSPFESVCSTRFGGKGTNGARHRMRARSVGCRRCPSRSERRCHRSRYMSPKRLAVIDQRRFWRTRSSKARVTESGHDHGVVTRTL